MPGCGWLFFYSVFARAVRLLIEKDPRWIWGYAAVPFFSYACLFAQLNISGFAGTLFGLRSPDQRLWLFAVQFFIFALVSVLHLKNAKPSQPDFFWMWSRFFMHGYFLICFFIFDIYRSVPLLGVTVFLILAGEILIGRFFYAERKLVHA